MLSRITFAACGAGLPRRRQHWGGWCGAHRASLDMCHVGICEPRRSTVRVVSIEPVPAHVRHFLASTWLVEVRKGHCYVRLNSEMGAKYGVCGPRYRIGVSGKQASMHQTGRVQCFVSLGGWEASNCTHLETCCVLSLLQLSRGANCKAAPRLYTYGHQLGLGAPQSDFNRGVPQFWGALGVPQLALTKLASGLAVGQGV